MVTYTSDTFTVTNGGTTTHTPPRSNITITNVQIRYYGISDYTPTAGTPHTSTESNSDPHNTQVIATPADLTLNPGETFTSASMTISGYHTNASNQNLTLWHGDPAYSLDTYTENNVAKNTAVSHEFTITEDMIQNPRDYYYGVFTGVLKKQYSTEIPLYVTATATLNYTYILETKTQNPSAAANGETVSITETINNAMWSNGGQWTDAPDGFIIDGANTITHTIAGSQDAGFQFRYDYSLNPPIATGYLKVKTPGGVITVRLADPTDANLEYTTVRIANEVEGVETAHCIDVVSPTTPNASGLRIQTQNGILAFRKVV